MITTAIFDMDGLLIDSEPLWREVEIELFTSLDVPITEDRCRETTGLRTDETVGYWFERYPWEGVSPGEVTQKLEEMIIDLVKERGMALPGVESVLMLMHNTMQYVALASSSRMMLIEVALGKLNIRDYFDEIHSAEHESFGKPHPGVYITTAQKLGVKPMQCVVFEDSLNGVLAAKTARMKCIAVPEKESRNDPRYAIADLKINSLVDLDQKLLDKVSL